jgi:Rps23 Pro-64 3,4-dihydroxylase Tpa1-like proline 4-hydroxylase
MISECKVPSLNQVLGQKYPELKYEISDDFVGVYDNVFSRDYCNRWIKHFEEADANGLSYNRAQGMGRESHVNADQAIDYAQAQFYHNHDMKLECAEFNALFWDACYSVYAEKFSILKNSESHKIYTVKVQRTRPKEGYHIWHCEDSTRLTRNRLLTFMVYLNDIEDGGETEFLYLSKRVKPVAGRVVIWPSGFTHTHRGNPPLKDTKYIITGWIEF